MSNKTILQNHNEIISNNNISIDDLIESINNLPEAGGEVVEPTLQEKTITPTTSSQTIEPDTNYDGLSKVTINGVTSAIDSDIKATNIRSGVNILGVTGTLVENEDLSSELTTQNTLLTSQTSKLSDVVVALKGKASGGSSEGTSKLYTGGSVYFTEAGGGSYICFLSISPDIELKNGEICKLNFANYMDLMTSGFLTTVSVDRVVMNYSSSRKTYSGSFEVDLTQFGYGTYSMEITISLEYGFAMISYSTEDTTQGPLNIGIYLEQTGEVADL
jgi:hypothetical protein